MATFSLVHGAWGLGLQWDLVRAELEARGHAVHTPDMPCEDLDAGVDEYIAAVPPCDIVVGHSLGGMTIPYVGARLTSSSAPLSPVPSRVGTMSSSRAL